MTVHLVHAAAWLIVLAGTHTALGDARRVRAIYDAVTGGIFPRTAASASPVSGDERLVDGPNEGA